jgi:hypothetical protein
MGGRYLAWRPASMRREVRQDIVDEFDAFLGNEKFLGTLNWHFAGDATNQARVPEIIRRLRTIAGV